MNLNLKACTGCGLCVQICPKGCITMELDSNGFLAPHIDKSACIGCGLCEKSCPNETPVERQSVKAVYTGYYPRETALEISTSGGIFTALAEYIIEKKQGYVFGAQFDQDFSVFHSVASTMEDVKKFCGSKYIGSDTRHTFLEARELLEKGHWVLYTGTPCQIAGLKAFLKKDYPHLITCDFVCHGVGSSKVWFRFLNEMEQRQGQKVTAVRFRSKIKGYHNSQMEIGFLDESKILFPSYKNPFGYAFASDLITRESCGDCKYCTLERTADITVADYSGNDVTSFEQKNGSSLILLNTKKASEMFQELSLVLRERTLSHAVNCSYHLTKKASPNPKREQFFIDFTTMDFDTLEKTYLTPPEPSFVMKLKQKLKAVLKQ